MASAVSVHHSELCLSERNKGAAKIPNVIRGFSEGSIATEAFVHYMRDNIHAPKYSLNERVSHFRKFLSRTTGSDFDH